MKVSIARRAATFALIGATAFLMAACSSVKLDDTDGANGSGSGSGSGSASGSDSSAVISDCEEGVGDNGVTVRVSVAEQKRLDVGTA